MQAVLTTLVLVLALGCVITCIVKPKYAIVPLLMLYPAKQVLSGYIPALSLQYSWVVNVVVGLIAVFALAYQTFRGGRVLKGSGNKITWLLFGYFAWILVSVLWSPAKDSALFYLQQGAPYFVLLYMIAPLLVSDLDDLAALCVPSIVTGAALMVLLLVNPSAKFINDRFVIDIGYQAGVGQVASNPLAIADAGAILAITAAIYRPNSIRPVLTLIRWGSIFIGLTLALLSGSRGQVLAGVAIIAIFSPMAIGSKSAFRVAGSFIFVGLTVMFLMYVFQNFVVDTAQQRWTTGDRSNGLGERMEMATTLLGAYWGSPAFWLTGLGSSAFNAVFTYRPDNMAHWYPHNILVEALGEYGIVGITLVITILVLTGKASLKLLALAGQDRARRSTVVVFTAITAFNFMMSLKQGATLLMPMVFMFCLIIGRVAKNEAERAAALEYDQDYYGDPEYGEYTEDDLAAEPAA